MCSHHPGNDAEPAPAELSAARRGGEGAGLGVYFCPRLSPCPRLSKFSLRHGRRNPAKVWSGGAGQPAAAFPDLTGSGDDLTSAPRGDLCDRALDSVSAHLLPAAPRDARVRQGSQLAVLLAAFLCVLLPFLGVTGVEERQGKPACCSSYGTAQHLPKDQHLPEGSRAFGVGKPHGRGPSSALGSGWRGRCEVASKRC